MIEYPKTEPVAGPDGSVYSANTTSMSEAPASIGTHIHDEMAYDGVGSVIGMITGWGDESGSRPDKDPGTYIMATALCEDDDLEQIRSTMLDRILPGETKVHWHGSDDDRRLDLCRTVADLPLTGIAVVHHQLDADDRRHRRKCLETMLPFVADYGCDSITLESRGGQDASDIDILQKFRAQKIVTTPLRLTHSIGRNEAALWVADVICGAITQHRIGNESYLQAINSSIGVTYL